MTSPYEASLKDTVIKNPTAYFRSIDVEELTKRTYKTLKSLQFRLVKMERK